MHAHTITCRKRSRRRHYQKLTQGQSKEKLTQGGSDENETSDMRVLRSGRVMARRGTEDIKETKPQLLPSSAPPLPSWPQFSSPHLGASSSCFPTPPPRPGDTAMNEVVCEICGDDSDRDLIANCVECSSYQHRYCMPVVAFSIPPEWICSECQQKANGDSRPNQGGQNELQSASGNVVHQISPYTRKRFSSAKVKFISSEEVASLNRDRRPYSRSNSAMRKSQVRSMSPSLKQHSYMKCTSPTSSDTQTLALTQCTDASHGHGKLESRSNIDTQQNQVGPASPLHLKQPSSMKSMSPSRNGTQVQSLLKRSVPASHDKANIENNMTGKSHLPPASPNRSDVQVDSLKRCVAASHEARKKDLSMNWIAGHGSSMPMTKRSRTEEGLKGKVDSQFEDKNKEKKIASADKASTVQHECREKEALCASVDAPGCESEMKSPGQDSDTILIINSSVENSRRPSSTNCWTGSFHVLEAGSRHNFGEFKAYLPSKVSRKVYDIVNMMPSNLQFEILPRMKDWPKQFERTGCFHEDIALFFLPNKFNLHEKEDPHFFETTCNYVMRGYINDVKLLIYSSEVLPADSQWVDGKNYLWGVFVRPKGKRGRQHISSTYT